VEEVITIGLDLAKSVFQAHGADRAGGVVFRKKLRRDQLLAFFASQPRCLVAMEACADLPNLRRASLTLGLPSADLDFLKADSSKVREESQTVGGERCRAERGTTKGPFLVQIRRRCVRPGAISFSFV